MIFQRIVAGLFALLFGAACPAASLAERSPFAQGQWWDPTRAGNGFEIVNVGDLVAVIWFTYNDAGQPTWYAAQGSLATLGTQAWPLMQHRWGSDGKSNPTIVGSLKLTTRHPESAEIAWEIGSGRGTWSIQPLILSGVISEVDHSGVWFDPRNGGWGLSLTEQGETFGGVLYTYDFQGAPTWIAGFERSGLRSVEFHSYTGACPACPYRPSVASSVGRLSFDLLSEAELALRS
ncbi:MAG TPA: hypothetical protein VNA44_09010, partial [Burkholderiaceae bacterium]|nr:hypothetical protein [Burkholderiaceae bacterium]